LNQKIPDQLSPVRGRSAGVERRCSSPTPAGCNVGAFLMEDALEKH